MMKQTWACIKPKLGANWKILLCSALLYSGEEVCECLMLIIYLLNTWCRFLRRLLRIGKIGILQSRIGRRRRWNPPHAFTFALEFGESDRWGWWSFIEFIFHLKNRSCRSPPVAGWNLYALVRYSCHVKGRYTCGLSSVMSSWGASTVALKGGFKKQARDRRFENPFTAALCKTLLYLVLLRTCKSNKTATIGVSKPEIPNFHMLNLQQDYSGQEDDEEVPSSTVSKTKQYDDRIIYFMWESMQLTGRQIQLAKKICSSYPQHNPQHDFLCFLHL